MLFIGFKQIYLGPIFFFDFFIIIFDEYLHKKRIL